jgi:hypothetical protein
MSRCESAEAFQGWYRDSVMWREFDASAKAIERRSGGRNACRRMKDLARVIASTHGILKLAAYARRGKREGIVRARELDAQRNP